ncbi:CDP-archaeol synthase [Candidatus Woesearchaeota archaeon]|jgi:CDP-2,3-bis-(O-geranylgeranyl)-sn-glycerol synthase|nr:CDP-archaeol synthase [Candidatus Woesearchaeota archaeon]
MVMKLILQTLWLFLPALLANMTPPLVKHLNVLNSPVDFGLMFRGKRLLGQNKTIRGLVFGVFIGIIVASLQTFLFRFNSFQWLSIINYSEINFILLGGLLGFGALIGDLVESFVKRQFDIKPGKPFIPFDQIDFLIGAIVFLLFIFNPGFKVMVTLLVVGIGLHFLTNYIGYLIGHHKTIFG